MQADTLCAAYTSLSVLLALSVNSQQEFVPRTVSLPGSRLQAASKKCQLPLNVVTHTSHTYTNVVFFCVRWQEWKADSFQLNSFFFYAHDTNHRCGGKTAANTARASLRGKQHCHAPCVIRFKMVPHMNVKLCLRSYSKIIRQQLLSMKNKYISLVILWMWVNPYSECQKMKWRHLAAKQRQKPLKGGGWFYNPNYKKCGTLCKSSIIYMALWNF